MEEERKETKESGKDGVSYEFKIKRLENDLKDLKKRSLEAEGDLRCLMEFLKVEVVTFKLSKTGYPSNPWKHGKRVIKKELLEGE